MSATQSVITQNNIIQTQKCFSKIFDSDIINVLIHLFDKNTNKGIKNKIIEYIQNERKLRKLSNSNISIQSELYGEGKQKSTLFVKILKNNNEFIHLSIHLCQQIKSGNKGMIHIYKNFYEQIRNQSVSKKKYKNLLYALISISQPPNKPNSLVFSIADGYDTLGVKNAILYDSKIQQEMDSIIAVLNLIFDEEKDEYIGKHKGLYPIHNKTNLVLDQRAL